jgi:polyisoprenoid-binding protein YceI
MRSTYRTLVPLLVCLLATGCLGGSRTPPVSAPPAAPVPPPSKPAEMEGATLYKVNPAASRVDILVYRGGTLARLGHNHVMTSKAVTGRVWVHSQIEKSGFEMAFPVAELIVDDADARRAAGAEFPPDIPQADKDGTRKNMLRAEVLDAERFPQVSLRSVRVAGSLQAPQITTRITLKDQSREVEVPAKVEVEGSRLRAQGEFDIQQTSFGMKPFSVALGAIAVKDQLHIKFSLVAEKTEKAEKE